MDHIEQIARQLHLYDEPEGLPTSISWEGLLEGTRERYIGYAMVATSQKFVGADAKALLAAQGRFPSGGTVPYDVAASLLQSVLTRVEKLRTALQPFSKAADIYTTTMQAWVTTGGTLYDRQASLQEGQETANDDAFNSLMAEHLFSARQVYAE